MWADFVVHWLPPSSSGAFKSGVQACKSSTMHLQCVWHQHVNNSSSTSCLNYWCLKEYRSRQQKTDSLEGGSMMQDEEKNDFVFFQSEICAKKRDLIWLKKCFSCHSYLLFNIFCRWHALICKTFSNYFWTVKTQLNGLNQRSVVVCVNDMVVMVQQNKLWKGSMTRCRKTLNC